MGAHKKYELTPEHAAHMPAWRDKWIASAMSTAAMTEFDRSECREAVLGLYRAANLPPPKHIVFVPSPFVLRIAGGFAAAIWHLSAHDATLAATYAATLAATSDATSDATYAATSDAWYSSFLPRMISLIAGALGPRDLILSCAESSYRMWDGGNQWAGYPAWLSFLRHVARLPIDYSKWDHYEVLAERSGPRIMHPEFCMISDRPELLTVDDQNRPHNETGPFCRWRDGTSLYSVHGVRVPEWLIEQPELLTVDRIHSEDNEEVRRVMVERYGLTKYVRDAQFEILDQDIDPVGQPRRLLRRADLVVVEIVNSTEDGDGTRRVYHVACHPELRPLLPDGELGKPQKLTALNAVASTYGMRGKDYVLEVET